MEPARQPDAAEAPGALAVPPRARRPVAELSDAELLALLAGPRAHRHDLCALLDEHGIAPFSRAHPERLRRLAGLSRAAARRLACAFELGRRAERARASPRADLRSPERVHALLAPEIRALERETFHVLLLDGKHRLRRRERVSEGTLTTSLVHPREVFGAALREGAAALIVAHNHPSGDPEPSAEDLAVTRRLIEAGKLVGVPLLDHVVLADQAWVSLRERMSF